ncbi:MAG: hypothetical protein QOH43_4162 [Solirubrobacteraceae bacterium]|jgi:hypothetical protein|nr:hypothetical protein [Solirubrobacteraceae bacterium]
MALYCPHCFMMVAEAPGPWPPVAQRCPHCRLVIGAARARTERPDPGHGTQGSAAGVLSNQARREDAIAGDPFEIAAAVRLVAARTGCRVERLRMLDYQEHASVLGDLPSLATILATYGSWKQARRVVATGRHLDDGADLPAERGSRTHAAA